MKGSRIDERVLGRPLINRKGADMGEGHFSWGTKNELDFLRGLGNHGKTPSPREALLAGYIKAAYLRENWDGIDRDVVISAAESALAHEYGIAKRRKGVK